MENNGQAVTPDQLKAELHNLEQRLEGKLDASEQRVVDRVSEIVRDSETRILKAFYGFAESSQKRMTQMELSDALLVSRFGRLENRLTEVEKHLNIPPAA